VDAIIKVLLANADNARTLVKALAPRLKNDSAATRCSCRTALEYAVITPPAARDTEIAKRLEAVAGRVLKSK
jgi:5'-methylthioadenosine phosphorylase